jgi:DNA-binding MarR family transcriptional regulator/ribosomal protein S18 acetylase RimI-like enzyme
MNTPSSLDQRIAAIRAFNRFYTNRIGVVRDRILTSRFSLTEARVLYELANAEEAPSAGSIGAMLDLDAGYLSRILRRFETDGLLTRAPAPEDRRRVTLCLTEAGRDAFAPLDQMARQDAEALLTRLPEPAQEELVTALRRTETLLGNPTRPAWTLRAPRPGDIGWVVARHGALYAEEYGFDARFEALVAQVAGTFLATHDPARERCWIAEADGARLGSVFLVRESDDLARLRLLIVEPTARGLGIGRHLVETCVNEARALGYRRMTLWTNDILVAARGIYRAAGFRLTASAPHNRFGPPMVGEDWERDL